jgi:hypothetical protein
MKKRELVSEKILSNLMAKNKAPNYQKDHFLRGP